MSSVDEALLAPSAPAFGDAAVAARRCARTVSLLAARRSVVAQALEAPGPSADELGDLLRLAARVPDHGKLAPWRFIVIAGEARAQAGAMLADIAKARTPDITEDQLALERQRFTRAPLCVAVVSRTTVPHKVPEWEQILSAGAVCQTLLIAAHAMGYAGQWLTEWYAFDPQALAGFGLQPGERMAGYVFLGSAVTAPMERKRPDVAALTTHWRAP